MKCLRKFISLLLVLMELLCVYSDKTYTLGGKGNCNLIIDLKAGEIANVHLRPGVWYYSYHPTDKDWNFDVTPICNTWVVQVRCKNKLFKCHVKIDAHWSAKPKYTEACQVEHNALK